MKVVFAADHAGYHLKEALKPFVESLGYEIEDKGAFSFDENDDYVPFIKAAAEEVAKDPESVRGIVLGGSGMGEA
ncbi:MAG: RpiB/LacA/LacB family sugar-phosphate isomerase, partial [Patescibacteria group bacterium]